MIAIRPQAGLANRMRSLDSAIQLANILDEDILIYWVRTPDFNCSFFDLFKLPSKVKIKESDSKIRDNGRAQRIFLTAFKLFGLNFPRGYDYYYYHNDILSLKKLSDFSVSFPREKSVFLQTDTRFYSNGKDYEQFVPSNNILEKVKLFLDQNINSKYIGIHIRRTDNLKSIANSPTQLFIESMENELFLNPAICFYLATDSPEEERDLKKKFGEKIVIRKKELERSNPIGIQDALIDLMILSKAQKIYGSFYSSFSETAAAIGKVELKILTAT